MTDAEKTSFDEAQAAAKLADDEFIAGLKTTAGFDGDDCDDNCKSVFEAELLVWKKQVYETCKANSKSIECREANTIKKDTETARAASTDNFYATMTKEQRESFDNARQDAVKAQETALAAQFIKDNRPTAGVGAVCGPSSYEGILGSGVAPVLSLFGADDSVKCTQPVTDGPELCCGVATQTVGANVNDKLVMCNERTVGLTFTNDVSQTYTFECMLATKLASSVAAAAVAMLYM